jgi:hypothetical protein
MMKSNFVVFIILTFSMVVFNSCGVSEDTKWGIDHETTQQIPRCSEDKNSTKNAIPVYEKQEIEQLSSDTVIRIWHYQNGDKLVCTVSGKAIVNDKK